MKKYLAKYINQNMRGIGIFFFLVLLGILIGLISYNFLADSNKQVLLNSIKTTLDISKQDSFSGINILKNGLNANLVLISIIILASLTIIAPLILCILCLAKGFSIGIYIAIIFSIFGFFRGLLVTLLLVIIPNIFYLPTFIYICVNALNFHYQISDNQDSSHLTTVIKECYKLCIGIAVIILSIIIEQSLSYGVFAIYSKL